MDITNLKKTAKMIDEDHYWQLVLNSLTNSANIYDQKIHLINSLLKLSLEEIIGFRLRTDKLLYETYNSEMWCAAYIMNVGCSDDGFEYFRLWVISRGKDIYYQAKENPDSLINVVSGDIEEYEFEGFWYVALDAFKMLTEADLYDYIDYDTFKTREGNYPDFEFTWDDEEDASMKIICPKLFKKFLN